MKTYVKTWLGVVIIVAFAITVGAFLWTYEKNQPEISQPTIPAQDTGTPKVCTQEAKICPDGSYVSRTGPNCEFAPCSKLSISGSECASQGGYVFQSDFNKSCPDQEINLGEITDVNCPCNCCKKSNLVGNDKDEHGCIGSAGYTWCETKQKCLRIWEEECGDNADQNGIEGEITIEVPQSGDKIASPLEITGKAVGSWFWEGSFPVQVYDDEGKLLGSHYAPFVPVSADDTWMTEGFVNFKSAITFSQPSTSTGYILFQKDNPSDLPGNSESFKLPIKFY